MNKLLIVMLGLLLASCRGTPEIEPWQPMSEESLKKLIDHDDDGVIVARDTCDETTLGRDVDNDGCSPESEKEVYFEHPADFDQGKTILDGGALTEFESFISELDRNQQWNVLIQGYTHTDGDMLYNKVMAKRRMAWVAKKVGEQLGAELNEIRSRLLDGHKVAEESSSDAMQSDVPNDQDNDGVLDAADKCPNSDYQYLVDVKGCTAFENRLVKHTLTVRYPRGSAVIDPIYAPKVQELADFIAKYKVENVEVYGHTSAPGSAKFNQTLSEKRAQSVVDMLITDYQVDADKLVPIGKGETELLEKGDSKQANILNRRVEIALAEVLKIERPRDLGIVDADSLNRRVVVFAQSTQLEYKDRWHIFIMESAPSLEQSDQLDELDDMEYEDVDAESMGW